MRKIFTILFLFQITVVDAQTFILNRIAIAESFNDSLYLKEGSPDSLWRKNGVVYEFAHKMKVRNYTPTSLIIGGGIPADWGAITNKPATFPPSSHDHTVSNVTDFPTTTAVFSNSTNKNFVTDANLTVINNTSGTNTGDQNLSGLMVKASNLSDVTNSTTARTNIGAAAVSHTHNAATELTGTLPFANGGLSGSAAAPATTGTMTINMTASVVTITPTGACTFNASGGVTGQRVTFVITTSGTTSFVLTWGSNYRKVGTLATGTVSARFFSVTFVCVNGTIWQEESRTAAQT